MRAKLFTLLGMFVKFLLLALFYGFNELHKLDVWNAGNMDNVLNVLNEKF